MRSNKSVKNVCGLVKLTQSFELIDFWTLTIIYAELKYSEFWGEVWVPSQASFFQNNCRYMMIIYILSNLD